MMSHGLLLSGSVQWFDLVRHCNACPHDHLAKPDRGCQRSLGRDSVIIENLTFAAVSDLGEARRSRFFRITRYVWFVI
jgi:hypothetical protein